MRPYFFPIFRQAWPDSFREWIKGSSLQFKKQETNGYNDNENTERLYKLKGQVHGSAHAH